MINYSCDLCGDTCNHRVFSVPIAATFVNGEPCDLIPVNMNLCKECRSAIYKTIKTRTNKEQLEHFNSLALNIKMKKVIER